MRIIKVNFLYLWIFFILVCLSTSVKAAVLEVVQRNRSDGEIAPGLTFSGAMSATPREAPWVMADQYVEVEYRPDAWRSYDWGLTIVTDNRNDPAIPYPIAGKPTDTGPKDARYDSPGPDGIWGTGDDDHWYPGRDGLQGTSDDNNAVTYGGLINVDYVRSREPIEQDPNIRASLCWQVYRDKLPTSSEETGRNALKGRPDPDDCMRGRTSTWGYTKRFDWNSDWAYIIDKGDSRYQAAVGRRVGDYSTSSLFYDPGPYDPIDPLTGIRRSPKYFIVAYGVPTDREDGIYGVLTQHPVGSGTTNPENPEVKMPNDSDRDYLVDPTDPTVGYTPDIVIYIGARFYSERYREDGTSIGDLPLPAGNYGARIYLELWHY